MRGRMFILRWTSLETSFESKVLESFSRLAFGVLPLFPCKQDDRCGLVRPFQPRLIGVGFGKLQLGCSGEGDGARIPLDVPGDRFCRIPKHPARVAIPFATVPILR